MHHYHLATFYILIILINPHIQQAKLENFFASHSIPRKATFQLYITSKQIHVSACNTKNNHFTRALDSASFLFVRVLPSSIKAQYQLHPVYLLV